jgi:uracil-DNA glycosylase
VTLEELEQAAQGCVACPLCTEKKCFGSGPVNPWLVVLYSRPPGKAHAYSELFAEVPYYETAITKCEPGPDVYAEDVAACEPFLAAQLHLLAPRVILAMGREAAQALHSESPGRWRGQTFLWEGVRVITTFHPELVDLVQEADAAVRVDITAAVRRSKAPHGNPT